MNGGYLGLKSMEKWASGPNMGKEGGKVARYTKNMDALRKKHQEALIFGPKGQKQDCPMLFSPNLGYLLFVLCLLQFERVKEPYLVLCLSILHACGL